MKQPARELIARCKEGDKAAWNELILAYQEDVARWVARLDFRLTPEDIADLRQEIFLKATKSFHNYKPEHSFTTWLYTQTSSLVIDFQRYWQAEMRDKDKSISTDQPLDEEGNTLELIANARGPDEVASQADEHRLLQHGLSQLGDPECRCRQLIELRFFGGFTVEEVAESLKMNPITVRTRLHKCLKSLNKIVEGVFPGNKAPPVTNKEVGM